MWFRAAPLCDNRSLGRKRGSFITLTRWFIWNQGSLLPGCDPHSLSVAEAWCLGGVLRLAVVGSHYRLSAGRPWKHHALFHDRPLWGRLRLLSRVLMSGLAARLSGWQRCPCVGQGSSISAEILSVMEEDRIDLTQSRCLSSGWRRAGDERRCRHSDNTAAQTMPQQKLPSSSSASPFVYPVEWYGPRRLADESRGRGWDRQIISSRQ